MNTAGWRNELESFIGPSIHLTAKPLENILDMAVRAGCKTILVEKDYVDTDYLDEYATFYCRSFFDYPSKCTRLHFFKKNVSKDALFDLKDFVPNKDYFGFSVVRPIRSFRTSRTAIQFPEENEDTTYILCKANFGVNLLGWPLSVCGAPFIQQETNVSVCAQAALWMLALYMHQKYETPRFKPSEITKMATQYIFAGPVRDGLSDVQILSALREMGFSPVKFSQYSPDKTAEVIYSYVESEIPVILGLTFGDSEDGHAVVAVGHDFHVRPDPLPSWTSNINWIDNLFVLDDNLGPYQRFPLSTGLPSCYSIANVSHVFVPVPPGISMQANDVLDSISPLLKTAINGIISAIGHPDLQYSPEELSGLVFRTYLTRSNTFKEYLQPDMDSGFAAVYRNMPMPKYIWVIEISVPSLINVGNSRERKIIGEIVVDPTADRHRKHFFWLVFHLYGRMLVRRKGQHKDTDDFEIYANLGEEPYGHLVRRPSL